MALFSKNWKQIIVSAGEPFQIEYLDRKFGGRSKVVFKIDDATGAVLVNGVALTGTQNVAGDVVATGNVQAATLHSTGAATIGTNATVGGTLGVTGVATFTATPHLPAATLKTASIAGADASGGTVSTTLAGAVIGQKVVSVIALTGSAAGTDVSADFEATISVTGHIQQTSTNLSVTAPHILVQVLN